MNFNKQATLALSVGISILLLTFSCKQGTNKEEKETISIDELMSDADKYVGDTINLTGFCVDVCGHGANHITLVGNDTTKAIQAVADKNLKAFSNDLKYNNVSVRGVIKEQRVDSAYLQNWEEKLDESLKGPKGNPEAVAQLKLQIAEMRDSIASRNKRLGRNYWSQVHIETLEYAAEK